MNENEKIIKKKKRWKLRNINERGNKQKEKIVIKNKYQILTKVFVNCVLNKVMFNDNM